MDNYNSIILTKTPVLLPVDVHVPGSKSESNRALILKALAGNTSDITNLSTARDTSTLNSLISNNQLEQNVLDAGTTMRFLTAFYAATGKHKILTGTERMQERPIKILVDALQKIGCDILYKGIDGYPPIEIKGFKSQKVNKITIPANVSSQYISAILMIAPVLSEGLTIELEGEISSEPYIQMTLQMMALFGVQFHIEGNTINVPNQAIRDASIQIEPDWSGASYWYGFAALADNQNIHIPGLQENSRQGDKVISEIMTQLGVTTHWTSEGASLQKSQHSENVEIDFSDCPDLAQTVAVVCAGKKIPATLSGLKSLRIKETDRIYALQKELSKIGCQLNETRNDRIELIPGDNMPTSIQIETYEDHRMAMSFAPLCTLMDMHISDPNVVNKSYPEFWEQVKRAGINTFSDRD